MLVDSHCHLNYPQFSDLHATIERAKAANVQVMLTISTKRSDFDEVIAIAEAHPEVYASIGVHPHEAEHHADLTLEELLRYASHPRVIGIGETGLDYYYEHSPRDVQQAVFRIHIEAARLTGLPLIVHSRDADEDMATILHEEHACGAFTGLMHCFSSSKYLADKALEIGFMLSASGIITFNKSQDIRDIFSSITLDSLLVETDAPYLAPVPHRGQPNEPAYTRHTADMLSKIKNVDLQMIEEKTSSNFFKLFSKAARPDI